MEKEVRENFYNKLHCDELDVTEKLVFVRVDFNVPLDENGEITDDTRITAALKTITYLVEQKARIVLASHLGRPKGRVNAALSLAPVATRLSELLEMEVTLAPDCIGPKVEKLKKKLKPGEILLLENLRFHPGEKKNSENFIKALAAKCELYINDAFGTSHRDQASMTGVPRFVSQAATGYLVRKELDYFMKVLADPKRPFVAILGGAKVSDKIGIIQKLLEKVDSIMIGGGMAYTFLKALKFDVGNSLVETDRIKTATDLLGEAKDLGVEFLLPSDNIVARKTNEEVKTSSVKNENIPSSWMALDIGPETVKQYAEKIDKAKTIFWNGPMGVFEDELFRNGTRGVAEAVANSEATSIVGGGDSVAALKLFGLAHKINHISTGGGASLELVEGKILPGIAALTDRS